MGFATPSACIAYTRRAVDFGTPSTVPGIKPPKGLTQGRLLEIEAAASEAFTAVTTPGYLRVGTSGDADAFAEMNMSTLAAGSSANTQDDPDAIISGLISLDAGAEVVITPVAPTGGTPAGIADLTLYIEWF